LEAGAEVETAIGIVIATETEIATGIKIAIGSMAGTEIATRIRIVTAIAAVELAFTRKLISRASDSAWIKANV